MEPVKPPGLTNGADRAAPYQTRPPSPPYIHVPAYVVGDRLMSLVPHFSDVDSGALTEDDLQIITQGKTQVAQDTSIQWKYESRRHAQPILDFLYLGPASVTRDLKYLAMEGFTMILACRQSGFSVGFLSVEKAAAQLGIVAEMVDIDGGPDMVRAFSQAVRKINNHLLDVYRSQAVDTTGAEAEQQLPAGKMVINLQNFKRGKVLACCETGNDRSAAVVAAYIMTVFGVDMVKALQFVALQRFCATFDDNSKYFLQSYQDLLQARRDVARQMRHLDPSPSWHIGTPSGGPGHGAAQIKRRIEDTISPDSKDADDMPMDEADEERYAGRSFAPFVEHDP